MNTRFDPQGEEIVDAARKWIGTPYRHQASTLNAGCDCLGLLRGVWRDLYGAEPAIVPPYERSGNDDAGAGQLLAAAQYFLQEADKSHEPGRVVLFTLHPKLPPRHCGILVSDTQFIHAQERVGVIATGLDLRWQRRIHSLFAFPGTSRNQRI